uniref:Multiple coagulation factor deficiency protein 2 homolog n=1 Tax=Phallusia mammillata TaxID=59560 RepID=A0A6F9DJN6_9ASCI|nr:multiple coagulation factor deficiency protein 2 homolog [Phallusia mammillata]
MSQKQGRLFILLSISLAFANDDFKSQMDPSTEHNKAHLKEDLSGIIDKNPEDMNPVELQFHYFRQHDYDNDEKLDGNELAADFIQLHVKNAENVDLVVDDRLIIDHVDGLMKQTDQNGDGYVDFHEYKMYINNL